MQYENADSFPAHNAHTLATLNFERCKEICVERGYGGFVHWKGTAYFRAQKGSQLDSSRIPSNGSMLFILLQQVGGGTTSAAASTGGATSAEGTAAPSPEPPSDPVADPKPAAAPPPPPPRDRVPDTPAAFPTLESLNEEELRYIKANRPAMDDWILRHPQARIVATKLRDRREATTSMARSAIEREGHIETAMQQLERARAKVEERRKAVEALQRKREEIAQKFAPKRMALTLAARAQQADHEAESALSEALEASGTMDAAALSRFRESYTQQKEATHWRLALKARLESNGA